MSGYQKEKPIPLSEKDVAFWKTEIKQARDKREEVATKYGWKENLERYGPKARTKGVAPTDISIGAEFRDVERKRAALFFDTPEVGLVVTQDRELPPIEGAPPPPQPVTLSTLVSWHQDILNELLVRPDQGNVKHAVMKAIFECLCPSGVGPVSVGYQVTMGKTTQMVPVMDAAGNPVMEPVPALEQVSSMLGLAAMPIPKPMMAPKEIDVPIYERWFISPFSSMALLIPASFRDTAYQRAPWLGKDFRKPVSQLRREYNLPKEWTGTADETKPHYEHGTEQDDDAAGDPYVTGVEIYYRKSLRSDEEVHPEAMRCLVFVDGKESEPLEHRESPHQNFSDIGEMTPDSLLGFADRPLVLRDLSDSAYVPSDCSMTAQLTLELEKFRERSVKQRNNSPNVILFDSSKIDPTAKDKIMNGEIGAFVPVVENALMGGVDTIMKQVAQPTLGRENFIAQDYIESDKEKILGIGANQSGKETQGRKTATEQQIVQRNSEARFEQERTRVLEWFSDVVSAFDTLIIRYADARIATQVLGEVRGQIWAQYKSHLAGGYTYSLKVDSGKYLDIEADRRQWLQFYNQVRPDPLINPKPILLKIAETWGIDPTELIAEPKKPEKEMKASISFKATEDFNPMNPAFAINVALARQAGWIIDEDSVRLAQGQAQATMMGAPVSGVGPDPKAAQAPQTHPGAMGKAPTIDQHQADESGDRSGPKVAGGSVM